MRLTMEFSRTPSGHLEGMVDVGSGTLIPFSGTLELLKVLHDLAPDGATESNEGNMP